MKKIDFPSKRHERFSNARVIFGIATLFVAGSSTAVENPLREQIPVAAGTLEIVHRYEPPRPSLTAKQLQEIGNARIGADGKMTLPADLPKFADPSQAKILFNGKVLLDDQFEVEKIGTYKVSGHDVVLVGIVTGGNACADEFAFVTVRGDGTASITPEFSCADPEKLKIVQAGEKILVSAPCCAKVGQGPATYVYEHGEVAETRRPVPTEQKKTQRPADTREMQLAARNAVKIYRKGGMVGLIDASEGCYRDKQHTGFYCVAFDVASSLLDISFAGKVGAPPIEYFDPEKVLQRARPAFAKAELSMEQANKYLLLAEDTIQREVDAYLARSH